MNPMTWQESFVRPYPRDRPKSAGTSAAAAAAAVSARAAVAAKAGAARGFAATATAAEASASGTVGEAAAAMEQQYAPALRYLHWLIAGGTLGCFAMVQMAQRSKAASYLLLYTTVSFQLFREEEGGGRS